MNRSQRRAYSRIRQQLAKARKGPEWQACLDLAMLVGSEPEAPKGKNLNAVAAAVIRRLKATIEEPKGQDEAIQALGHVENAFLVTFGWTEVGPDQWKPPPGYRARENEEGDERTYHRGHAVNSQKQSCFGPFGSHRGKA